MASDRPATSTTRTRLSPPSRSILRRSGWARIRTASTLCGAAAIAGREHATAAVTAHLRARVTVALFHVTPDLAFYLVRVAPVGMCVERQGVARLSAEQDRIPACRRVCLGYPTAPWRAR